jgi:hypothetical protein
MEAISPDRHDSSTITPRCTMADAPAEPNHEDVNTIHLVNMYKGMIPEVAKYYKTTLKDEPLSTILCYPLLGIWNTQTIAAAHLIEQALKHAYPVQDLKNTFIDNNRKTHNRNITSLNLSKTGNQVMHILLIRKLGLDLAFTLHLLHVFANCKIAFVVVNPSTTAPIMKYIGNVVGSGIRPKEVNCLTNTVMDKIHKSQNICYLVSQDYKAP